jgi:SAM-dependent methyltransferase
MPESTLESNLTVYNQYVHEYTEYRLYPPEREILRRFRLQWANARFLDIGIGTGRTTYVFAALVARYVGIDYAEGMLQACRKVIPENETASYRHCDARDLSSYYGADFDFVMFSMNGIDSVDAASREAILGEIPKVLAPGGRFIFSTHSIRAFSLDRPWPSLAWRSPVRAAYQFLKALQYRMNRFRHARGLDGASARKLPWAILKTGDHDFQIEIFHIDPVLQVQQLSRLGFRVETILDPLGRVADPATTDSEWLYYICCRE